MVIPRRPVDERSKLSPFEALELTFLSILGGKVLKSQHAAVWINYQENGNWMLDTGGELILHLHVYGRSRMAQSQPFGEALSFPLRRDFGLWRVEPYTTAEIEGDIGKAAEIAREDWTTQFRDALKSLHE
jgi:diadenosine tetraphosphate (Ap4A) HIT family hydrolase